MSVLLLADFIRVIGSAPNIDEMLLDERFDVKLMYELYKSWMNKHYPNKRIIREDIFLKKFGKAYKSLQ